MKFYILVVAILAFSTSIDAATFKCYKRTSGASGEGTQEDCDDATHKCIAYYNSAWENVGGCVAAAGACDGKTRCKACDGANCNVRALIILKCYDRNAAATDEGTIDTACSDTPTAKCVSYYDVSGNNLGKCLDGGCSNSDISTGSLHCKECTADNCNVQSLIRECYKRTTSTTSGDGTSTNCATAMADPKCVSYYDASGNNLGGCLDGGCSGTSVSSLHCKECTADNCNVRSLIRKCYVRTTSTTSGEGASTNCLTTMADPKCISYYDASGNNIGECKDGGCGSQANCQECTGDNCNVRSLVTTTAAPTTTPRAAATRASVGWQTGIMAASACVLVLIKPF